MSRPRKTVPTYQMHSTGRARVRTHDAAGKRVEIILPGKYGSRESKDAYLDLLKRLEAGGGMIHDSAQTKDITVAELVEKYLREHVQSHHCDADGTVTSEHANIVNAMKPLCRLTGKKAAGEVTPLDLRAYRDSVITGRWRTPEEAKKRKRAGRQGTPCRRTVNAHVGRIKRMFRWAVSLNLVPAMVLVGLDALPGLQPGRSAAKDYPPVEAVPFEDVEATLGHIVVDFSRRSISRGTEPPIELGRCDVQWHIFYVVLNAHPNIASMDEIWAKCPGEKDNVARNVNTHLLNKKFARIGLCVRSRQLCVIR